MCFVYPSFQCVPRCSLFVQNCSAAFRAHPPARVNLSAVCSPSISFLDVPDTHRAQVRDLYLTSRFFRVRLSHQSFLFFRYANMAVITVQVETAIHDGYKAISM